MTPEALPFFLGQGGRNNKRVDTTPALEAARRGSVGFNGLGLEFEEGFREASYTFHFPDGNASIARLLVNRLIPAALPGKQTMETIVQAPSTTARLDEPTARAASGCRAPWCASSTRHGRPARAVRVAYLRDGKMHAVRGKRCILACYNSLIPALVPESAANAEGGARVLGESADDVQQRAHPALDRVSEARRRSISAPGMYHTSVSLDPGTKIGGYRGVTTPGRADPPAPGAQSEHAGAAAARAEPRRAAGAADDDVRAVRARDPAPAGTHAGRRRLRSGRRHRRRSP